LKRTGRRIIGSPFVILFFDENAPGFRRAVRISHIHFNNQGFSVFVLTAKSPFSSATAPALQTFAVETNVSTATTATKKVLFRLIKFCFFLLVKITE
jgi:hypothetical protein